jgi:hypothetical protein
MSPLTDSRFCYAHDPSRARDRAKSRKKGGHNRQTPKAGTTNSDIAPVPLRDVSAVQDVLEAVLRDTLVQENSARRSRTVGYLLGIALKAIEIGELEARVEALENSLQENDAQR